MKRERDVVASSPGHRGIVMTRGASENPALGADRILPAGRSSDKRCSMKFVFIRNRATCQQKITPRVLIISNLAKNTGFKKNFQPIRRLSPKNGCSLRKNNTTAFRRRTGDGMKSIRAVAGRLRKNGYPPPSLGFREILAAGVRGKGSYRASLIPLDLSAATPALRSL